MLKLKFMLKFKILNCLPADTVTANSTGSKYFYWNHPRSRRVFLCFYSAIFQLTSAKFQTFAYNSRTVWSSYMNFDSSLRLMSYMFVPNFEAIGHVTGFKTRKPHRKFGIKSGLSQKRLNYGKKYFMWLYVLRYPFIPTNPLLAAMRFIIFFFLFLFSC